MSDNPLTLVNLNLKSDIFSFRNALSIIFNNKPSRLTPFGHNHILTTYMYKRLYSKLFVADLVNMRGQSRC